MNHTNLISSPNRADIVACVNAMQTLFFAAKSPIGRRLINVISDKTQKPVTGPWRVWNYTASGAKFSQNMPLIDTDLIQHIWGTFSCDFQDAMLLCYAATLDGTSVYTAIDLDVVGDGHSAAPEHFSTREDAYDAAKYLIAETLAVGLTPHLEVTKSAGYRIWIFHHMLPAAAALDLGRLLLSRAKIHSRTEIYPRQGYLNPDQVGSAVFLPYNGRLAREGRQVMIDPETQTIRLLEDFCLDALAHRSDPAAIKALLAAAEEAGEFKVSPAAPLRSQNLETGENVIAKYEGKHQEIWGAELKRCPALVDIVLQCKDGQTSYDGWLKLATHLKPYGDWGLDLFHTLSAYDHRYDEIQTDDLWDSLSGGPTNCAKMGCGRDPQYDCGLPEGKINAINHAYAYLKHLPQVDAPTIRVRKKSIEQSPAEEKSVTVGGVAEENSSPVAKSAVQVRPTLVITGLDFDALVKDALRYLAASNNPPTLYSTGGRMHIIQDLDGRPVLVPLTLDRFRAEFAQRILVQTSRMTKEGLVMSGALPPDKLLQSILSLGEWPGIPECRVVSEVPLMAPDGSIQSEAGYHPATRAFLASEKFCFRRRPESITRAEAIAARDWFFDLPLSGFPFADASSRVHTLCALLQNFVMSVIDASTPLYLVDALLRSSGKTLLAETVIGVSCDTPITLSLPENEAERQKTLVSTLMARPTHVLFDNATGDLRSASLEGVLTSRIYSARVLGVSNNVALPVNATFLLTANQAKLSTDLSTRSVYIRLDPGCESPETRDNFRISDLHKWMSEHRAECVAEALKILSYWSALGMPLYAGKKRHRQGRWASVMGGIMEAIDLGNDFLGNTTEMTDNADDDTTRWRAFIMAWWEEYGRERVTTQELMRLAFGQSDALGRITDADGIWADKMWTDSAVRLKAALGKWLTQKRGRIFADRRVSVAADRKNGNKYMLEPLGEEVKAQATTEACVFTAETDPDDFNELFNATVEADMAEIFAACNE